MAQLRQVAEFSFTPVPWHLFLTPVRGGLVVFEVIRDTIELYRERGRRSHGQDDYTQVRGTLYGVLRAIAEGDACAVVG